MNISVQFHTAKLPVAYRLMPVSIIKHCVRIGDENIYHKYFADNRPKPYTFSIFLQNFRMGESEIELSGFRLNLSSSEYEFIIPFLNGLQKTSQFQYRGYSIRRGLIQYGRDHRIQSSKIIVSTNSPILIEDENHRPLKPGDPSYARNLNVIANKISMSLRGHPLNRELRIEPISVKKVVIKEMNETFQQAVESGKASSKYLYFTAYAGRFLLEGHPQDLQWLLDTGAGLRSAQGFGHLRLEREVIAQ